MLKLCSVSHCSVCRLRPAERRDTVGRVADATLSRHRTHITVFSICVASLFMHVVLGVTTCDTA